MVLSVEIRSFNCEIVIRFYLLCFVIFNFCITARLNPIRLVNGRGLIFSERLVFVGVIADKGGRDECSER